jgi:hypothetical protein
MKNSRLEKTLSSVNELATAILLIALSVGLLGENFSPGPQRAMVIIEEPVTEPVTIGSIPSSKNMFGKPTNGNDALVPVTVDAPVIIDGKLKLRTTEKILRGYGSPRVIVTTEEALTPILGEPSYRRIKKFEYRPNITYVGSGETYLKKTVVFDGLGESSNIREAAETTLAICAMILLLLRIALAAIPAKDPEADAPSEINNAYLMHLAGCRASPRSRNLGSSSKGMPLTYCDGKTGAN